MKNIKITIALLFGITFFSACSSDNAAVEKTTTEELSKEKAPVHATMIADLGISGMSCEVNCVSSIKKALLKMEGVASFEMEFDAEKDVNHAFVKFDNKVVSPDEMIATIESVNDGIYKVESNTEENLPAEGKVNSTGDNSSATNGPGLSVFNLVHLLLEIF
ncbi:MAG: cation transporter [Flavobacteriales bacterium]